MLRIAKRLFYLGSIFSIGSFFESALTFLFIPVYTAYLGTYEYGIIGLMSITVELVSRFIAPPFISGFIRYYHAPEYRDKKGVLLFNSFLFLTAKAFILAIFFFIFSNVLSVVVLKDSSLTYIVKIYAFILFFHILSSFLSTFLKQIEKAKIFVILSWTRFFISASVALFGLIFFKIGILALIYAKLTGVIYTFAFIVPIFWQCSSHKISFSILRKPLKYGYPLFPNAFSNILIQSADRYILRIFFPLSVVGLYSFGYIFAGILDIILITPIYSALQPLVLKHEDKPEKLKNFLSLSCLYFYFTAMFFCLMLSLYSKEAIEIMARREEFWNSWIIVPIIALAYLLHGLGNFVGWGLVMTNKVYNINLNVFIAALVNIVLNFIFIPLWGIIGAAFATLISYFIWNALKIYYSARFYDLHFDLKRLKHITIIGVGLYLISLFVANTNSVLFNIALKFLFLLIYPIIFFVTNFFTPTEKKYLQMLWVNLRENGLRETYAKIKAL